jgi:glucose/arabinose dehydrogenase
MEELDMPCARDRRRLEHYSALAIGLLVLSAAGTALTRPDSVQPAQRNAFPQVQLPPAFQIEKVTDRLSFAAELTFDDRGRLYVAEAGGGFEPVEFRPPRILRVDVTNGSTEVVVDLTAFVVPPVVGLAWDNGWLYFTHRDFNDTGALSRVRDTGGTPETLLTGFVSAQAEHFMNGIAVRDGWVYFGVGQAGNSGVLGPDVAPFVQLNPGVRPVACRDLVMRGHNFLGPNILGEGQVLTGAYGRFGEITRQGQVIAGQQKCGGAVHRFRPDTPDTTLEIVAFGLRQPIGLTFNSQGELFTGENGYDVRGLRPVNDQFDATLRIRPGHWYGFPDFSAAREPLHLARFDSPDELQAPIVLVRSDGSQEPLGRFLDFVIDHGASGLTPPDRSLVLGLHPVNASPSGLDVAPESWGQLAGQLFVAEWGDLSPPTNPLREQPAGFRIIRVDPSRPQTAARPFVQNRELGPASEQGAPGSGLERPFDVKFGPDIPRPGRSPHRPAEAMYISDYGIVEIDFSKAPPYRYIPDTGVIWRVTRRGALPAGVPPDPVQGP